MMSIATRALMTAAILGISVHAYAADAAMSGDAKAVNSACQAEATTAGCGQEVVGKGLLKCIGAYKKAHQDFKISDGCHNAVKQMSHDRKAAKESSK
jgi:hypothetical protein